MLAQSELTQLLDRLKVQKKILYYIHPDILSQLFRRFDQIYSNTYQFKNKQDYINSFEQAFQIQNNNQLISDLEQALIYELKQQYQNMCIILQQQYTQQFNQNMVYIKQIIESDISEKIKNCLFIKGQLEIVKFLSDSNFAYQHVVENLNKKISEVRSQQVTQFDSQNQMQVEQKA